MIQIKITDNVTPWLEQMIREIPKAAADAVNWIAEAARNAFIAELLNRMTLRTSWFKPGNAMGFKNKARPQT